MQWNPPIWSRQVASFWQGLDMHSFTSISQRGPSYPCRHLHWKEPNVLRQRPPCSQGLAPRTFRAQVAFSKYQKNTLGTVLTLLLTKGTLVNIQVAGRSCVTWWTCTNRLSIHGICVTVWTFLAGVADAGIIQMAQQPWRANIPYVIFSERPVALCRLGV